MTGSIQAARDKDEVGIDGFYVLKLDSGIRAIRMWTGSFWTAEIFATYDRHFRQMVGDCKARFGRLALISDVRDAAVQSQDITNGFGTHAALFTPADKLAIVVTGNLARMQMRRLTIQPGMDVFLSVTEAETWVSQD